MLQGQLFDLDASGKSYNAIKRARSDTDLFVWREGREGKSIILNATDP